MTSVRMCLLLQRSSETTLRNFSCLTTGDSIMVAYNNRKYYIDIVETKPSDVISIIETDCEVDFVPPLDYKEPERHQQPSIPSSKAPAQGIRDYISTKSACLYGSMKMSVDDIIPNITIRKLINRIRESTASSREKSRSLVQDDGASKVMFLVMGYIHWIGATRSICDTCLYQS